MRYSFEWIFGLRTHFKQLLFCLLNYHFDVGGDS